MPLVSVIILCHNQGQFVGSAIRSVADQTFFDYELVVIDNGSQDESVDEIRRTLQSLRCSAQVIALPRNLGIPAALNRACAVTSADYIVALAADDLMLADRLRVQVTAFSKASPRVAVMAGHAYVIDQDGLQVTTSDGSPETMCSPDLSDPASALAKLIGGRLPVAATTMHRRSALIDVGGFDESLLVEDYDLYLRLVGAGYEIALNNQVVAAYRVHSRNTSKRLRLMREADRDALRAIRARGSKLTRSESVLLEQRLRTIESNLNWLTVHEAWTQRTPNVRATAMRNLARVPASQLLKVLTIAVFPRLSRRMSRTD